MRGLWGYEVRGVMGWLLRYGVIGVWGFRGGTTETTTRITTRCVSNGPGEVGNAKVRLKWSDVWSCLGNERRSLVGVALGSPNADASNNLSFDCSRDCSRATPMRAAEVSISSAFPPGITRGRPFTPGKPPGFHPPDLRIR